MLELRKKFSDGIKGVFKSFPGPQGKIQKEEVTGKLEFIKKMEIIE